MNDIKGKTVLNGFIAIGNESKLKTKKYALIKEEGFTINLYRNG